MATPRRIDVVLDSVKRLLRIGATANLSNLLQKQHPADLAQIFGQLPDRDRIAAFSVLVERNSRLAMETLSELGPETGAQLLAGRSAEEIAKLVQELPSDDAAALIDNLPEELSTSWLELMGRKSLAKSRISSISGTDRGRIMNPMSSRSRRHAVGKPRGAAELPLLEWCFISTSSMRAGIWRRHIPSRCCVST